MPSPTTMPLWLSALLVIGVPVAMAMSGPYLVRRLVPLETLRTNNEVAGFKFAVVGVLYAVLLAFAVIVVWERFTNSETQVAGEAGAAATIYRLADAVHGDAGPAIRRQLSDYLKDAIVSDWPAMATNARASESTTAVLNGLYKETLKFSPADARETAVLSEILRQLDLLTQARRARLVAASGAVPGILWAVLVSGGFLTVGFTLFFGAENLRAQSVMTGILAFIIFSGLFVIIAIDHPFAGVVKVTPEALSAVLKDLGGYSD
jgi:hypothetical protein